MNLKTIAWPVYKISNSNNITTEHSVSFIETMYTDSNGEEKVIIKVIDDKNLPGTTLGRRRLVLRTEGRPIKYISKAIFMLGDLLNTAKSNSMLIDNNGVIFKYTRSTMCRLSCHKINNIIRGPDLGVVLILDGVAQRFKLFNTPPPTLCYAGVLDYEHTKLLYGLYEKPFKQTRRKI